MHILCTSGAPLSPVNITATPTSPCTAVLTWTIPQDSTHRAVVDTVLFEIRYITEENEAGPWAELARQHGNPVTPPLEVTIPSAGVNTTYELRGQSSNFNTGGSVRSDPYGHFVAYPEGEGPVPEVVGVSAGPQGPSSVMVSWGVTESACYAYMSFSASCASEEERNESVSVQVSGGSDGGVRDLTVSELVSNSRYSCRVFGSYSEVESVGGERRILVEDASEAVSTFTYPDRELWEGGREGGREGGSGGSGGREGVEGVEGVEGGREEEEG